MKKLILLLLILTLTVSLIACGNDTPADPSTDGVTDTDVHDTGSPDTDAPVANSTYTVTLSSGIAVEIGGNSDALIESLGDPIDYMEAPSCVHSGYDKVYSFGDYCISTSPAADGTQYVSELVLLSDAISIDGGLMIGSELSVLEAKFGTDYTEEFGIRTYSLDGANVAIIVDEDTVMGITISSTR